MAHIYSNNNVFLTFLWAKKSRPLLYWGRLVLLLYTF